jgi:glycyl-tRNA synthetase beta chain
MSTHDLLFELGCEELPATHVGRLAAALSAAVQHELGEARLQHGAVESYFTPRRIAVLVTGLVSEQETQAVKRRGPSVAAAYDQHGNPTLACIGFARSCGCSADELGEEETPKGRVLCYEGTAPGVETVTLLPELLQKAVAALPQAKPMRWADHSYQFLRPVRWALLRYGETCVDASFFGCQTIDHSYGHRFHCPGPVPIPVPGDYAKTLMREGMVVVEADKRKQAIREALEVAADGIGTPVIEEKLLDEVAALIEWPVILRGRFDERFLAVPTEVLITSMQSHQKCFPVLAGRNKLAPAFLLVSNIDSKDPKLVIRGNERVIAARLADAEFFYQKDLATPLVDRQEVLEKVVFAQKLGSIADKSERLQKLAAFIGDKLELDKKLLTRSAALCKCDLVTGMVGEFPSLQGVMGCYYAKHDKEPKEVIAAIAGHYHPRFATDSLPKDLYSAALGLADRIDSLVGIFGINKKPKGDKDPFGLRRAALGVVRLIIGLELPLDLKQLVKKSITTYGDVIVNKNTLDEVLSFIFDRLHAWYLDQGVSPQVFAAVLATGTVSLLDFSQRVQAVMTFQAMAEADALAAANKRVMNILKKNKVKDKGPVNKRLLKEAAEKELVAQLADTQKQLDKQLQQQNYSQALAELASLEKPVDNFFTDVMIMAEDAKIRDNRLAILNQLRNLFTAVADISEL